MKQYIIAAILILTAFASTAGATDWHVNSGESIQAAINGATTGDMIYVHAGTYSENVLVNKTLTLQGDGAGVVTVQAASAAEHVFNVTADHVNITGFTATGAAGNTKAGIYLGSGVDHCNISDNNASNCNRSIYLNHSSDNVLTGNIANSGDYRGILLSGSNNNTLLDNSASGNIRGIHLHNSSNNTLANNVMTGNTYNFGVLGTNPTHYVHDIDPSNLVNGKPIRYWVGQQGQQVPDDAGYVGVVNCDNITVMDMRLTGNLQAVLLAYSIDSVVRNVTASDNYCGIFLYNSTNNALVGNNVSSSDYGIYLQYSSDNSIAGNIANSNTLYNINLVDSSSNNTLMGNNASGGNYCGIAIALLSNNNTLVNNTVNSNGISSASIGGFLLWDSCNHNNITGNNVNSNIGYSGILLFTSCVNNIIAGNTVNSNDAFYAGIMAFESTGDNVITENTVINNSPYGIRMYSSSGNTIHNNYFANIVNAYDDGSNIWNTTPTAGPNIVGGPEIGGNYWSDYTGTDDNNDGFGGTPHPIGSSNHDYLPLVMPVCGDITGDGNIDTVDLLLLVEYVVKGTPVDACIGDIDGNGQLNSLDALLLMGYINDSTGYSLNCGC
jgi:parallel beta-helix repeat protein